MLLLFDCFEFFEVATHLTQSCVYFAVELFQLRRKLVG